MFGLVAINFDRSIPRRASTERQASRERSRPVNVVSKFQDYNLRIPDVAKLLGYHEQYVRFMAAQGKLPGIKRGRIWLFNESEIFEKFKTDTKNVANEDGASDLLQ